MEREKTTSRTELDALSCFIQRESKYLVGNNNKTHKNHYTFEGMVPSIVMIDCPLVLGEYPQPIAVFCQVIVLIVLLTQPNKRRTMS